MGLYEIQWHSFTAWDNGYHTVDINIPPATVGAQTWLYGTSGGGSILTGIKHYRKRLGNGQDEDHDFGDWLSWPPVIADFISSVTYALATGDGQEGWAVLRMDYWE
jgi:hypothetical protein